MTLFLLCLMQQKLLQYWFSQITFHSILLFLAKTFSQNISVTFTQKTYWSFMSGQVKLLAPFKTTFVSKKLSYWSILLRLTITCWFYDPGSPTNTSYQFSCHFTNWSRCSKHSYTAPRLSWQLFSVILTFFCCFSKTNLQPWIYKVKQKVILQLVSTDWELCRKNISQWRAVITIFLTFSLYIYWFQQKQIKNMWKCNLRLSEVNQ